MKLNLCQTISDASLSSSLGDISNLIMISDVGGMTTVNESVIISLFGKEFFKNIFCFLSREISKL